MNSFWRLAVRLLLWRQDNRRLNWSALLSAGGVALGGAVLILSLSVLNGFQLDVEESLQRFEGRGTLQPLVQQPDLEAARRALDAAGIASQLYAERKMVLQTGQGYRLVTARIVPDLDSLWARLSDDVAAFEPSYPAQGPQVIIGSLLADKLAIFSGDELRLLSPLDISLANPVPKQIQVTVRNIFEIGLLDFDDGYIFISFETAGQLIPRLAAMSSLSLLDDATSELIANVLPVDEWGLETWRSRHADLISAMEIEKLGSAIVLFLIVLVASFNATSTMVMSVMEKYREIGILRSLGASRRYVINLFLLQGLVIGIVGVVLGVGLGVGISLLQAATGFIPGPGMVYSEGLPMVLEWQDVGLVMAGTMIITLLAAWYPARYAADIEPGQAVNYLK